jgi:hypothetical protein
MAARLRMLGAETQRPLKSKYKIIKDSFINADNQRL